MCILHDSQRVPKGLSLILPTAVTCPVLTLSEIPYLVFLAPSLHLPGKPPEYITQSKFLSQVLLSGDPFKTQYEKDLWKKWTLRFRSWWESQISLKVRVYEKNWASVVHLVLCTSSPDCQGQATVVQVRYCSRALNTGVWKLALVPLCPSLGKGPSCLQSPCPVSINHPPSAHRARWTLLLLTRPYTQVLGCIQQSKFPIF